MNSFFLCPNFSQIGLKMFAREQTFRIKRVNNKRKDVFRKIKFVLDIPHYYLIIQTEAIKGFWVPVLEIHCLFYKKITTTNEAVQIFASALKPQANLLMKICSIFLQSVKKQNILFWLNVPSHIFPFMPKMLMMLFSILNEVYFCVKFFFV